MQPNGWDILLKVIEGVSYLATVSLAYFAFKGLKQIKIARRSISLESERDALRVTNEAIRNFYTIYMIEYEKVKYSKEDKLLLNSVKLNELKTLDFSEIKKSKEIPFDLRSKNGRAQYVETIFNLFERKRQYYNMMESFSAIFTSGLGNDTVSFRTLGRAYCSTLEDSIELLTFFGGKGYYSNLIALYRLWKKRVSKDDLIKKIELVEAQKNSLEDSYKELEVSYSELDRIKKEISEIEDEEIKSIGTVI